LGDCVKEADETAYWLDLLVEGDIVAAEKLTGLRNEIDQLIALFVIIIKHKKANIRHTDSSQPTS
jgi:four helix bundle protein